jgi:hypothetical protein
MGCDVSEVVGAEQEQEVKAGAALCCCKVR